MFDVMKKHVKLSPNLYLYQGMYMLGLELQSQQKDTRDPSTIAEVLTNVHGVTMPCGAVSACIW